VAFCTIAQVQNEFELLKFKAQNSVEYNCRQPPLKLYHSIATHQGKIMLDFFLSLVGYSRVFPNSNKELGVKTQQ
jgi:hypothetical protein